MSTKISEETVKIEWKPVWPCGVCGGGIKLNERFDSHFCPRCDAWTEEHCGEAGCDSCEGRPERPSMIEEPEFTFDKRLARYIEGIWPHIKALEGGRLLIEAQGIIQDFRQREMGLEKAHAESQSRGGEEEILSQSH